MKDVTLITYSVADLETSKRFFGELIGADPYADSPYYVGYKNGEVEIGLVAGGTTGDAGAIPFWTVADIAASLQSLVAAGGTVVQDSTDVGYGLLVARAKDPNGAIVGLRQFPPSQTQA